MMQARGVNSFQEESMNENLRAYDAGARGVNYYTEESINEKLRREG